MNYGLFEQIRDLLKDARESKRDTFFVAQEVIDLVRADERRRIREALEAMYDKVTEGNTDTMGGYSIEAAGVLEGLSTAIGLTEEEQE